MNPKKGDRIRLVAMPADPDPVPTGTVGTVRRVNKVQEFTQIEVDWDNGRRLMLTVPPTVSILGDVTLPSIF